MDYDEIVTYWIDELTEEFPDLPLEVLKIEYADALGSASNERLWALGSDNEEDEEMCYINAEMNMDYANWINNKAIELYGESLV